MATRLRARFCLAKMYLTVRSRIQVVEAELERIEVQGLNRLQKSYVRSRIAAAKTLINIRRLESALQLLQLDPLFTRVQAELTAGTVPGNNILILNLKEAPPLSAALIVDNHNSPSVGSTRGTAVLSHNNLSGLGDRALVEVGISEGVEDYNISYLTLMLFSLSPASWLANDLYHRYHVFFLRAFW